MKKILLEILLGIGVSSAVFHSQLINAFTPAKPVNKEIHFSIARDARYDANVYDMTQATLQVIVFKVKDHHQTILWSKVYDTMQVKKYPTATNALQQTVRVKNITDGKEQLFVTYIITYNTKGNCMKVENGTSVLKGEKQGRLAIHI